MLKQTKNWNLSRPEPDFDPNATLRIYVDAIPRVPGVLGVWAQIYGGVLHIYTLMQSDADVAPVFLAQLPVFDSVTEPFVDFRVTRRAETIAETPDLEPILVSSTD